MAHEAGKGSGRRNEDVSKVKSNWDLIDWSVTTSKKAVAVKAQEEPKMNEYDDEDIEDNERSEDADDYEDCSWCSGSGEGMYDGSNCKHCGGSGVEPSEKDYDDI